MPRCRTLPYSLLPGLRSFRTTVKIHTNLQTSGIYPMIRELRLLPNLLYFITDILPSRNAQRILCKCMRDGDLLLTHPKSRYRAWVSNNVEGSYKRSVTLAMVISLLVTLLFLTANLITVFRPVVISTGPSARTCTAPATHHGTHSVTASFSHT